MKLTSIKTKIRYSIYNSISYECLTKTDNSTSFNIRIKIRNEIRIPNLESISGIQIGIINNLENEIN